jgi:hypothetical protein
MLDIIPSPKGKVYLVCFHLAHCFLSDSKKEKADTSAHQQSLPHVLHFLLYSSSAEGLF